MQWEYGQSIGKYAMWSSFHCPEQVPKKRTTRWVSKFKPTGGKVGFSSSVICEKLSPEQSVTLEIPSAVVLSIQKRSRVKKKKRTGVRMKREK